MKMLGLWGGIMNHEVIDFFANSEDLLDFVLKPLEHIRGNWDLIWDSENECYVEEEDSFGAEVNQLINELATIDAPQNYHEFEDKVAFFQSETWKHIIKVGRFWEGAGYASILEQGSFKDYKQESLVTAAAGRIKAAIERDQLFLDDMEDGHKSMLCALLSIILYQR